MARARDLIGANIAFVPPDGRFRYGRSSSAVEAPNRDKILPDSFPRCGEAGCRCVKKAWNWRSLALSTSLHGC